MKTRARYHVGNGGAFVPPNTALALCLGWSSLQTAMLPGLPEMSGRTTKSSSRREERPQTSRVAEHVCVLSVYGARRKYHHEGLGINSHLDAMQAAILCVKLKHVDEWTECKRMLAAAYDKELSGVDWLQAPYMMPQCRHTYHQYTIKVPAERRAAIQEAPAQAGIQTQVYYPERLHQQRYFVGKQELSEEPVNVKEVVPSVLNLPMSLLLPVSTAGAVCDVLCLSLLNGSW